MAPSAIRPAATDDRPAIERMAREVVEAGEMFPFDDVEDTLAYWYDPRGRVFVAELDGAVAGSYVLKPIQPGRGAHIANAGYMTLEAFRGRGVGRAMGEHSIATARDMGYVGLQYNFVVATNHAAVRLWAELGFAVVGRLPRAFRRPSGELADALVMHRPLREAEGEPGAGGS